MHVASHTCVREVLIFLCLGAETQRWWADLLDYALANCDACRAAITTSIFYGMSVVEAVAKRERDVGTFLSHLQFGLDFWLPRGWMPWRHRTWCLRGRGGL